MKKNTFPKPASAIVAFTLLAVLFGGGAAAVDTDSGPKAKAAPLLLAKSASFQITTVEFVGIASVQSAAALRELQGNPEKCRELLDKLINLDLLAEEAKRRGYDKNPEVVAVQKNRLATLMHAKIASQVDNTPPADDELRAYYQDHYDTYNKPEKIRARHILITSQPKAQELLARMKKEETSQYQFRKIARDESEDAATAPKGGDLAFFTKSDSTGTIDPRVVEAAFQIKANGDIFPQLVKTEAGYHIIMRTGYRKPVSLPFEEVRERIESLVRRESHRQKTEEALAVLQKKYHVELHEENLKHVVIDLTQTGTGAPPAPVPPRRRPKL